MGRPLLLPLLPLLLSPAFLQPGECPGPPRCGLCPNHRRAQPETKVGHLREGPGSHHQETRAGPTEAGAPILSLPCLKSGRPRPEVSPATCHTTACG